MSFILSNMPHFSVLLSFFLIHKNAPFSLIVFKYLPGFYLFYLLHFIDDHHDVQVLRKKKFFEKKHISGERIPVCAF